MIKYAIIWIVAVSLMAKTGFGQVDLSDFDHRESVPYKTLLKQARDKNSIALVVFYADLAGHPAYSHITKADSIKAKYKIVTDLIDPYLFNTHPLIQRTQPLRNPNWIAIHPDDIIIAVSSDIITDEQLIEFIKTSQEKALNYKKTQKAISQNRDDMTSNKVFISTMCSMYESNKISRRLNKYLRTIKSPSDKDLDYIIGLAEKCNCKSDLKDFINKRKTEVVDMVGYDRYLTIKQRLINAELKAKRKLEPYYVWRQYEKELGAHADSSYRQFAINYLWGLPGARTSAVDEAIDFLTLYPDTPWKVQEKIYLILKQYSNRRRAPACIRSYLRSNI